MLLDIDTIKKVGYFCEDLFAYYEDADLGWKLRMCGYKTLLCTESKVYHKYEFHRSIQSYYFMERNRYIMMFQNYKLLTLVCISPALFTMEVLVLVGSFFSGIWTKRIQMYLYFFRLDNWRKIIYNRRYIQSLRIVSDESLLKLFSGKLEFQEKKNIALTAVINPLINLYFLLIKLVIIW